MSPKKSATTPRRSLSNDRITTTPTTTSTSKLIKPSQPSTRRPKLESVAKSSRFGGSASLLLLSIVFHTIYLNSIFDVYFVSPVTKGVGSRYGVGKVHEHGGPGAQVGDPLAKRVVLIVGDGLRADKLFQLYPSPPFSSHLPLSPLADVAHAFAVEGHTNSTTPAPFVRGLIQSGQARWGISHTRVPTESRPGHVALIGGMYEDVSAVTRGWQTNPVQFDSVFNQSSHSFTFGSPDILPMFSKGASDPNRISTFSYSEEEEDFSKDAIHLDLWVLDQLERLLSNSTHDALLKDRLNADGTVFFLHLLGLDTTGHSYRPNGPEYHRNIRVVDHVISKTVDLLNEYYNDDGQTAYVFTADHGMSNKGNHGDGEPDNTRTPLVAWGKGIASPSQESEANDEYSSAWGLKGKRVDVDQADIAVLMSVLGGLAIPANSAGRVPLEYLDADPSFKARAAFANAKQILAEFEERSRFKEKHAISFKPYHELVDDPAAGIKSVDIHKADIEGLIQLGAFDEATRRSLKLIDLGLDGLKYFQTYDWLMLRSIVALGYVGFMLYSAHFILHHHVFPSTTRSSTSPIARAIGTVVFALLSVKFFIERSSPTYYAYAFFPCFFFSSIFSNLSPFTQLVSKTKKPFRDLFIVTFRLGALLVIARGYLYRENFSYLLIAIAIGWPLGGFDMAFKKDQTRLVVAWVVGNLLLAVFPQLPVEKGEDLKLIYAGAVIMFVLGLTAREILERQQLSSPTPNSIARTLNWHLFQLVLIGVSLIPTVFSAMALQRKEGLPLWSQVLGWTVLVVSILTPILHGRPKNQYFVERLLIILFAFGPSFIILSLSYEGLFYVVFCATLCVWLTLETRLAASKRSAKEEEKTGGVTRVDTDHVRSAAFFLIFLHVAFFGVGNVASISSFYLEPVYRLIPVFSPFAMALLLLFKLLTPFVALSAITSMINRQRRLPPFVLFIIASTLSDVLTINFFFAVTDEGSWLEIGSSITNFAISSLLCIFNTALYLGGEFLLAHTRLSDSIKAQYLESSVETEEDDEEDQPEVIGPLEASPADAVKTRRRKQAKKVT